MNERLSLTGAAPFPVRTVRIALLISVLLVLIGLVLFYQATRFAQRAHVRTDHGVMVEIGPQGCTPSTLSVPAGRTVFSIRNMSNRAVEWEILDGVMVVEERENIAPGFTQTLTANLAAGSYVITCGLLSNPRGRLEVLPVPAEHETPRALPKVDFIGPLSEYRVYVGVQSAELADAVAALSAALGSGDMAGARTAYVTAHAVYARIAPVAALFSDLDHRIDAQAALFASGEAAPAFSGFYRIASGLFAHGQTRELVPVAKALAADIATLAQRTDALSLQPAQLANIAARRIEQVTPLARGQSADAVDALEQIGATLEGVREIGQLLKPFFDSQPAVGQALVSDLNQLDATLHSLRDGDHFLPESRVPAAARAALAQQLDKLADDFRRANPALGL
jgi:iron uptake system component EfeO